MKLYRISQNANRGYDTYDSAVVCAESEEEAKKIHPSTWSEKVWVEERNSWVYADTMRSSWTNEGDWTTPDKVEVEYIGEAKDGLEKGVVVASFNAG